MEIDEASAKAILDQISSGDMEAAGKAMEDLAGDIVEGDTVLNRIADVFSVLEADEKRVERVVFGRGLFDSLAVDRSFLEGSCLDAEGEDGLRGTFWNASVYVNDNVPDGQIVVLPEGDPTVIMAGWAPSPSQLASI